MYKHFVDKGKTHYLLGTTSYIVLIRWIHGKSYDGMDGMLCETHISITLNFLSNFGCEIPRDYVEI